MIHHVIMFRWRDDATPRQRADAYRGLADLPGRIPELLALTLGEDTGVYETDYDLVALATFATREDFRSFRHDPIHRRLLSERLEPILASVARTQYEAHDDGGVTLLDADGTARA